MEWAVFMVSFLFFIHEQKKCNQENFGIKKILIFGIAFSIEKREKFASKTRYESPGTDNETKDCSTKQNYSSCVIKKNLCT